MIPDILLNEKINLQAEELCKDVDIKDSPYVALSLFLNKPLLTRDKPLFNHLKSNGFINVLLFDEFVDNNLLSIKMF